MSAAIASRIDEARLWERHMSIARHGATAAGGVNRQALSPEEASARREVTGWASALGLKASTDAAGNFFLRLEGTDPSAAPVLTGSHLDSQPTGGKFDGVYGVLAGLESVEAMIAAKVRPRRSIEIVAWMNEEGSRFVPGMMGSAAFAGAMPLEEILGIRDAAGVSVAEGLAAMKQACPEVPERALGGPVKAYVEAHIEQGPILEREGFTIGIVTGIQGKRTFRVTVTGEEAHAGTSLRRDRKDALLAATQMVQALVAVMHDAEDVVKFTVGRFTVQPNAPSVVPSSVVFSIDLRHPDSAVLQSLGDRIPEICAAQAGPCEVKSEKLTTSMSLEFPPAMRQLIGACAERVGVRSMEILSAAGHDARYLHTVCPTGMIFVPCKDGISHNEAESATASDLADGARVLAEALLELSRD
jgi:beta-ureidopropionase / N-carbamoyl-L-amino-acid hydrolase